MPPTGKPDRMPKAGYAQPLRNGHRIVLGRPYTRCVAFVLAIGWNRSTHPQPFASRPTPRVQIQPRMVSENLYPRPDDKHHKDDVEQMLPAQPPRKSRVHRRRKTCRRSRVTLDETLYPLVLAQ